MERGAESGTALEEGNPGGMFGLSGTMTRERIPTHNVVGSRPREFAYRDQPHLLPWHRLTSSAERSSVGEFAGHSLSPPHSMTEIAVFKHLYRATAMVSPSANDACSRALGLRSSLMTAFQERRKSSFKKAQSPWFFRAATHLQAALSKSLDSGGMPLRGIWVKNVWANWQKAAQPLHYRIAEGWDELDSARSCGAEGGPDGVKAKSDRISWSPGQAMSKEETAQ